MLCDHMWDEKDYPLCWLQSGHEGDHKKKHEVEGLQKEWARVMAAEKKTKKGRDR